MDSLPRPYDGAEINQFQKGVTQSSLQNLTKSRKIRDPAVVKNEIRGNQVVYLKALQKEDRMQTPIGGFSDSPKDNEIRIENRKVGAGMRITGDHPLAHLNLWSIRTVLAMEPFITMAVDPGHEFTWKMSTSTALFRPTQSEVGGA